MADIKVIRDTELIGGKSNVAVYPVTITQAIYSQDSEGNIRRKDGKPEKLEDRLKGYEQEFLDILELIRESQSGGGGGTLNIRMSKEIPGLIEAVTSIKDPDMSRSHLDEETGAVNIIQVFR